MSAAVVNNSSACEGGARVRQRKRDHRSQHSSCAPGIVSAASPSAASGAGTEGRSHRIAAENAVTITKAPSIRQLPLQRLWHERETNLESCIPDEQNDAPHQPEKAWLLLGTARDGNDAVGLGWTGRIGRQRHRPPQTDRAVRSHTQGRDCRRRPAQASRQRP